MTTKAKVILVVLTLVLAFAGGRYSVQQPNTSATTDTKIDKDTHTKKTVVIIKEPDGKETTTTVVERDTKTKTDTNTSNTTTQVKRNTLSVAALAGIEVNDKQMVYGASVSKEVLGPVTVGAWGLTNGTVGVSLGINF